MTTASPSTGRECTLMIMRLDALPVHDLLGQFHDWYSEEAECTFVRSTLLA
jgi:hypothetical protein